MKHLRLFEKVYYIICTEDLKKSLKKINCSKAVTDDILNFVFKNNNNNLTAHKYIYLGTSNAWLNENDWDWMTLEYEANDSSVIDGNYPYEIERYKFMGYSNLTPKQKKEVLAIKEVLKIRNDMDKFNL